MHSQQFQVSPSFPSSVQGTITLGPGQEAIVPVTFLPRFPSEPMEGDDPFLSEQHFEWNGGEVESISGVGDCGSLHQDLARLERDVDIDMDPTIMPTLPNNQPLNSQQPAITFPIHCQSRRSNWDRTKLLLLGKLPTEEYEVSTQIVVDTSHGIYKVPLSAKSRRYNKYGIPDVIRFYHPLLSSTEIFGSADDNDDKRTIRGNIEKQWHSIWQSQHSNTNNNNGEDNIDHLHYTPSGLMPTSGRDCFDVYMVNPFVEKHLEITEILVTRPDLMSVEWLDPFPPSQSRETTPVSTSVPSHVLRDWNDRGPLRLPFGSKQNYIATVCTAPTGVDPDPSMQSYLDEMESWIDPGAAETTLGFLQIRAGAETLFVALERMDSPPTLKEQPKHMTSTPTPDNDDAKFSQQLRTFPDNIKFHLVSSSDRPATTNIALQNPSLHKYRIVQVSIQMNGKEGETIEFSERRGVQLNMTLDSKAGVPTQANSFALEMQASSTIRNAFSVSCKASVSSDAIPFRGQFLDFSGSILIRGIDVKDDSDIDEEDQAQNSPWILEIPFTVFVADGRVEVTLERSTHPYPQIYSSKEWDMTGRVVSALFFPLDRFEAVENSETPLPTQNYKHSNEIIHDLRIMSNSGAHLELGSAEIVDENGMPISDMDSPCARLDVSHTQQFTPMSNYDEFEDIGFLSLRYKFDNAQQSGTNDIEQEADLPTMLPHTCFLNLGATAQGSSYQRIPIIIFPAQLDVISPQYPGDEGLRPTAGESTEGRSQSAHESVSVGFQSLLTWFRTSTVGKSLFTVFNEAHGSKTPSLSDAQLLRRYLEELTKLDLRPNSTLKPVLLKMGAIEHNEIARAQLLFTNHNPIPVLVSVDVEMVEGMSIKLGRDGNQKRGDGNSLLEYLPFTFGSTPQSEVALVSEGTYEGHPLNGLRQFLLSNEEALSFSDRFPFRDAVSMSTGAVTRNPFLKPLYQWYSYAEFHKSRDSDSSTPLPETSECDLSMDPPLYASFDARNETDLKQEQFHGALVCSGDKKLVRPLKVCTAKKKQDHIFTAGRVVTVPPGGNARFEVELRSPPQEYLEDDISQLVSTGLILSTNFGQVLPIFATFEALQGKVSAQRRSDARLESSDDSNLIEVPMRYYWSDQYTGGNSSGPFGSLLSGSSSIRNMIELAVPLHLTSSFSRSVRLKNVESCNPWFKVLLNSQDGGVPMDGDVETYIGAAALCQSHNGPSSPYPSFYQCALNWLSSRNELQPTGCGSLPLLHGSQARQTTESVHRGVRSVIQAFEKAFAMSEAANGDESRQILYSSNSTAASGASYLSHGGTVAIKSGRRVSDGLIKMSALKTFALAWDAWKFAEDKGLTMLSSNLQATIEYDVVPSDARGNNSGTESQRLSLSMRNEVQSALVAPRLVVGTETVQSNHMASSIEFPSTLVGEVVAMKIPLRNPSSVPVRVRLTVASPASETNENIPWEGKLRDQFLMDLDPPYLQSSQIESSQEHSGKNLWWDGRGSFFLADDQGNVIRTQHNVTIQTGSGAQVRIVNPSIHSSSAFVTGCGIRCGIREDNKKVDSSSDQVLSSIIGSASAAGITLTGSEHKILSSDNKNYNSEPYFYSGGVPLPGSGGPSAFAIPYSALDEIVIPPHGVAELGPVFFRPPGRYEALGCDTLKSSGARSRSKKFKQLCQDQEFEAMVFLENSLTGVERVVLKGQSEWEYVYFLDPPPREGEDPFGDIELRNGRSTLVFSGSGSETRESGKKVLSAIKQVFVHNGGDVAVSIESVYLSSNSRSPRNSGVAVFGSCAIGSFRLLNCWETEQESYQVGDNFVHNMHVGFELQPGQSRALFIEHVADCRMKEEFISLVLDMTGRPRKPNGKGVSVPYSADTARVRSNRKTNPLTRKMVDLGIGYSMNDFQLSKCLPVNSGDEGYIELETGSSNAHFSTNTTTTRILVRGKAAGVGPRMLRTSLQLLATGLIFAAIALLAVGWDKRRHLLELGQLDEAIFQIDSGQGNEKKRISQESLWAATFRCLARADPNSTELQALGREQTRQVVAGRYRAKDVMPPSSLSTSGTYVRDRSAVVAGSSSKRREGRKERSGGGERVRTLSDVLFRSYSKNDESSLRELLPLGLGWRVGIARGIIEDNSVQIIKVGQATSRLLRKRSGTEEPPHSVESTASDYDESMVEDETNSSGDSDDSETTTSPEYQDIAEDDTEVVVETVHESTTAKTDIPVLEACPEPEIPKDVFPSPTPPKDTADMATTVKNSRDRIPGATMSMEKDHDIIPAAKDCETGVANYSSKSPDSMSENTIVEEANPPTGNRDSLSPVPTRTKMSSSKTPISRKVEKSGDRSKSKNAVVEKSTPGTGVAEKDGLATLPRKKAKGKASTTVGKSKSKSKKAGTTAAGHEDKIDKIQSATKNESTEKGAEIANKKASSGIPPPPGLAPPPGFGNESGVPGRLRSSNTDLAPLLNPGVESASLGDMLTAALNSDLILANSTTPPSGNLPPFSQQLHSSPRDLLFYGGLGETPGANSGGDLSAFPLGAAPSLGEGALTGHGGESVGTSSGDAVLDVLLTKRVRRNTFDVMDFLDSILDDGGGSPENEVEPPGLDIPLSNNPWASGTKSRASAYGISFDNSDDGESETSPTFNGPSSIPPEEEIGLGPFPLLDEPSNATLFQKSGRNDENERALSFYASFSDDEM